MGLNCFVPPSCSYWLCRSPGPEGFQQTNPKHCCVSLWPILLQEMRYSETEPDMAAQPWLCSHCRESFGLTLAVWPSMCKFWAFQNTCAIRRSWVYREVSSIGQGKLSKWFLIVQKAWLHWKQFSWCGLKHPVEKKNSSQEPRKDCFMPWEKGLEGIHWLCLGI